MARLCETLGKHACVINGRVSGRTFPSVVREQFILEQLGDDLEAAAALERGWCGGRAQRKEICNTSQLCRDKNQIRKWRFVAVVLSESGLGALWQLLVLRVRGG